MKTQIDKFPKFKNESEEADWWASPAGRAFVERKIAENKAKGIQPKKLKLVEEMNKKNNVQIALRLPRHTLDQARAVAERKGIGYQTLIKMLVHEGLARGPPSLTAIHCTCRGGRTLLPATPLPQVGDHRFAARCAGP